MAGIHVFGGIDAHEVEAQLLTSLRYAHRDFTAVCNEHFMLCIHAISFVIRGKGSLKSDPWKGQGDPLLPPCPD